MWCATSSFGAPASCGHDGSRGCVIVPTTPPEPSASRAHRAAAPIRPRPTPCPVSSDQAPSSGEVRRLAADQTSGRRGRNRVVRSRLLLRLLPPQAVARADTDPIISTLVTHTCQIDQGARRSDGHSRLASSVRPAPKLAQLTPEVVDRPLELVAEGHQIGGLERVPGSACSSGPASDAPILSRW